MAEQHHNFPDDSLPHGTALMATGVFEIAKTPDRVDPTRTFSQEVFEDLGRHMLAHVVGQNIAAYEETGRMPQRLRVFVAVDFGGETQ
jgi:hypothetical protein